MLCNVDFCMLFARCPCFFFSSSGGAFESKSANGSRRSSCSARLASFWFSSTPIWCCSTRITLKGGPCPDSRGCRWCMKMHSTPTIRDCWCARRRKCRCGWSGSVDEWSRLGCACVCVCSFFDFWFSRSLGHQVIQLAPNNEFIPLDEIHVPEVVVTAALCGNTTFIGTRTRVCIEIDIQRKTWTGGTRLVVVLGLNEWVGVWACAVPCENSRRRKLAGHLPDTSGRLHAYDPASSARKSSHSSSGQSR